MIIGTIRSSVCTKEVRWFDKWTIIRKCFTTIETNVNTILIETRKNKGKRLIDNERLNGWVTETVYTLS